METAYFAAGCFWGVEHGFRQLKGVKDVLSGYMNGHMDNPAYKDVCRGDTGHAEAVKVVFDPKTSSYEELLNYFWSIHNPTTLNRQGADFGSQYRSGIYYTNEEQYKTAQSSLRKLEESNRFKDPIVTEIQKAMTFWPAEEYHQRYIEKNGGSQCMF